ncbi:group XIIB secretory phospholipase A2-like protein isoform X2 [Lethenteron reissneri]|uniref:group XIIB secretory phospholipase A2-like protein isoform X2 n=1 Tax=Lethenteron reissneri TaxID=7753 RepID=UPI002AB7DBDA|nr:group XIIB secretory phospholipase A2-like protein isoform X2 [Lethenteron reissneri]
MPLCPTRSASCLATPLLLLLISTLVAATTNVVVEEPEGWGLNVQNLRRGIEKVDNYLESMVEFFGGYNGECQYRCKHGAVPVPRKDYKAALPNGCATSLMGVQALDGLDLGIPSMTKCCNQLDICYESCGASKNVCDARFRICLSSICTDLRKTLGFISKIDACETGAEFLYKTVTSFGCKSFLNSQRASCYCEGEDKDEL